MSAALLEPSNYWRTMNVTSTPLRALRPTLYLGQWTLTGTLTTNQVHRKFLSQLQAHLGMVRSFFPNKVSLRHALKTHAALNGYVYKMQLTNTTRFIKIRTQWVVQMKMITSTHFAFIQKLQRWCISSMVVGSQPHFQTERYDVRQCP